MRALVYERRIPCKPMGMQLCSCPDHPTLFPSDKGQLEARQSDEGGTKGGNLGVNLNMIQLVTSFSNTQGPLSQNLQITQSLPTEISVD